MTGTPARAVAATLSVFIIAMGLASCGNGSSGASGKDPLDRALHYLPKTTPFVASIQTDPKGSQIRNAQAVIKKFPFAGQVDRSFKKAFSGRGANFKRDIEPLLGNEFIAAASDVRSFLANGNNTNFVGAIEVKDTKKLADALNREKPKDAGEIDGVKLKQNKDTFYAVDGRVLVFAGRRGDLEAAIQRARGDGHFSEADFDAGTTGLPKDAALRTYFNVKELIGSSAGSAKARKVRWVSALRTFGLTAGVQAGSIDVGFRLATDPNGLTAADLPMASGAQSPAVISRPGQIGFGLRGLDQIITFSERAAQSVDPAQYAQFQQAKATIDKQLNISIDKDIVGQLSGDLTSVTSASGRTAAKVALADPAAFKATLTKVNKAIPQLASGSRVRATGGLFEIASRGSKFYYGVVGNSLVLAQDPADAKAVAAAPVTKVAGAEGALGVNTNARQLAQAVIGRLSGTSTIGGRANPLAGLSGALGASLFTAPLGDLKGSVRAETDGISGKLSLTFN